MGGLLEWGKQSAEMVKAAGPQKTRPLGKFIAERKAEESYKRARAGEGCPINGPAFPEWQPIASAPHNRRVLVQINKGAVSEIAMGWWDIIDGQWYYSPQGRVIDWKPTHWMSLPEPPGPSSTG